MKKIFAIIFSVSFILISISASADVVVPDPSQVCVTYYNINSELVDVCSSWHNEGSCGSNCRLYTMGGVPSYLIEIVSVKMSRGVPPSEVRNFKFWRSNLDAWDTSFDWGWINDTQYYLLEGNELYLQFIGYGQNCGWEEANGYNKAIYNEYKLPGESTWRKLIVRGRSFDCDTLGDLIVY